MLVRWPSRTRVYRTSRVADLLTAVANLSVKSSARDLRIDYTKYLVYNNFGQSSRRWRHVYSYTATTATINNTTAVLLLVLLLLQLVLSNASYLSALNSYPQMGLYR